MSQFILFIDDVGAALVGSVRSLMHGAVTNARAVLALMATTLTVGCAATPWDFPVPTMIGDKQGVSMTGFMKTDSEDEVRRRVTERMRCPAGLDFASLVTQPADNAFGTKILHYSAVMRCRDATPPTR